MREAWAPMLMIAAIGAFFGVKKAIAFHEEGCPWWVIGAVVSIVVGVLITGVVWMWRRLRRPTAKQQLRDVRELDDYTGRGAAKKGVSLRDSIEGHKDVPMHQLGAAIGKVGRTVLWSSWEDVRLVFMGPRSNKTSAVAVPITVQAPGPVIDTSNKPDLWMMTAGLRALIGRVFVFDPFDIAFVPQGWWWNLFSGIEDIDDAERLAIPFVATVSSKEARDIWGPGAKTMLSQLFLAAALENKTARDFLGWIYTGSAEPVTILTAHRYGLEASQLATVLEGAAETRSGIVITASEAVSCLKGEKVLRWVSPPHTWRVPPRAGHTIEELDLWEFLAPRPAGDYPTLYLLTQEGTGSAGPIVAALVDALLLRAKKASAALGGRLDPPLTVMLDEAANVCPISELPAYYSWFGSVGISVWTLLQSYAQGEGVWGVKGMETLYSASTLNIFGAGLKDTGFAGRISASIGDHLVSRRTESYGAGGASTSTSLVREPIMPLNEIINLSKRNALWHVTGHAPVLMNLMPWYEEGDADDIRKVEATAKEQIRLSAIEALGVHNPIARHLLEQDRRKAAALAGGGSL